MFIFVLPNYLLMNLRLLNLLLIFSTSAAAQYSNKSIGFAENKGQIIDQKGNPNSNVHFLLNSNGLNVQLRKNGFSYDVYEMKKIALTKKDRQFYDRMRKKDGKQTVIPDYSLQQIFHRVDIEFEDSNPNVEFISTEKSNDYDNYYTVKHAPEGILMVYNFRKVTYKNLYPKIDVEFFVPEDSTKVVEYNFIIRPGGKVSDIKMKFNGLKTELSDSKIKMEARFGIMEETLPMSWTEDGMMREDVAVGYKMIKKNVYGFDFNGSQVSGKTIVIDPLPVRLWGTYYGGEDYEFPYELLIGASDDINIIGSTKSLTNMATAGSYQSSYDGEWLDLFMAKFNVNGDRIWGTYAPLHEINEAGQFAIDSDSNIFISSRQIGGDNVATPGAFQTVKNQYIETYLIKYNNQGFLQWATYYGGNQNEIINAICTDSLNNVYIVGSTNSTNVFSTPGAHQETLNSANWNATDGFIAKFSPDGQRIWGTYFGGDKIDLIRYCTVSDDNFLYIIGESNSNNNMIATPGSYLPTTSANSSNGFLAKFSLDGFRVWGTYLGVDLVTEFCVIKNDNLYISGITINETIGTPGTYLENLTIQPDSQFGNPVNYNSYLMKFNVQTQQKIWATYFFDGIKKVAVNEFDQVYFSGRTKISEGITTPNAYVPTKQPTLNKNYIVKLTTEGKRIWGTYYSGNSWEYEGNIGIDSFNDLYLYGMTSSTSGISTAGSFQSQKPGDQETYLVKFKDCLLTFETSSNSPVCIGGTIELSVSGATQYSWTGPNGFTSTLANPTIPTASVLNSGEYLCTITGTGICDDVLSVMVLVEDTVAPIPDVAALPTIVGDCNALVIPVPTATDACVGTISATTESPIAFTDDGTYTIVWNYTDGTNVSTQNQSVTISPQPLPTAVSPQYFCKQDNATLNELVITGQGIKWYNIASAGTLLPTSTLLVHGTTYYVSQTINGCESARIAVVAELYEIPPPSADAIQTFCDTQVLTLANFLVTGTDVVFYDAAEGGNLLPMLTTLIDGETYYASQTLNSCESFSRLALTPNIISGVPANGYSKIMCDYLDDGIEEVNLSDYNGNLIANAPAYTFNYYSNYAAAENQTPGSAITTFSNYSLQIGANTIYVRVMFANSCYEIVELELTVQALPKITMKDTYAVCENGFVTITADAGFDNYLWSTGATSQAITVTEGGSFSVTVSKNYGAVVCSSTKNITVAVSERATITSIETVDWTSSENVITVFVNGSGDYEYSVDGINYQSSNQFYGVPNGEYTVYVKDTKGCGVAKKDIYLLTYPKFFTPNGDSYNDFWGIQFYQNELNLVVKIFDRYGKFIKQLSATDPLWDGTYNGYNLPATDYWFTVIRQDGTEYKGHFSLKR